MKYFISFIVIGLIVAFYFWVLESKFPSTYATKTFSECEYKAGGQWYTLEILEEF